MPKFFQQLRIVCLPRARYWARCWSYDSGQNKGKSLPSNRRRGKIDGVLDGGKFIEGKDGRKVGGENLFQGQCLAHQYLRVFLRRGKAHEVERTEPL